MNRWLRIVFTHVGHVWAYIEHRKQLKGMSQHIYVKAILMLPLEMPSYIKA
jgi:hypothetical protein